MRARTADTPDFDPLDCLSFVAAATRRLLLGTGVLLLPYRHPVVLAKRLATIDVLSAGRMRLLTVGLGALPGEARAMGVDFRTRGRRADEAIDVLRLLWPGGPGGSSRAAARRAGRRGDGYFAGGMLDDTERDLQIDLARKAAAEAGRDPAALEYTRWGSADLSVEQVRQLEDRGVNADRGQPGPGGGR
ncbi:LLM class flavin-dependent oxidoreductase [Nocardia exalbida]|uniref:LLM class flavin-dependent oxidoreductase n=1 Tax=Nocardia exalbida TaxID=290231 RepID=UPI0002D470E8|nr:LLM class flavin-dependent oxidoreductase [Nocardia exalbida]